MAVEIDDKFEDVDFLNPDNWPDENKINGEPVFGDLGGALCGNFLEFEAVESLMTWAEIEAVAEQLEANPALGLDYLIRRVYNQKNEGSCVGNAGTQGLEAILVAMFGKDRAPELSAISLYKQIGRSPSSGAMVSDAMDALRDVGVLPLDTPKNREVYGDAVMPPTGFHTRWPDNWKETAANFRGAEFLVLRSVLAIFTALAKGYVVIVGREGHSILYLVPLRNRKAKYVNSWDESWGMPGGGLSGGFGVDSQRQVEKSASWAFAIRVAKIPETLAA